MNSTFVLNRISKRVLRRCGRLAGLVVMAVAPVALEGAGVLTPVSSGDQPLQLESHRVRVIINNGFARTEVDQTFYNPNDRDIEAVYAAPVPEGGALAELDIWTGEKRLRGEVVSEEEADRIYQEEKQSGNEVGKASQESYQRFEFSVSPVPANGAARMRYVYYEPLSVDTGIGRYVYRLEEGGTDDQAAAFWSLNDVVMSELDLEVVLKSAWPVAKTRAPGFPGAVDTTEEGDIRYRFTSQGGALNQDFVFYYMLEPELPGRVEMLTYRESEDKPGSFMMILTPGDDLQPLSGGADYVFALDVSGSMQGKLNTLIAGVSKAIGQLKPEDRFRIVAFNETAWDVTRDWVHADPERASDALRAVNELQSRGGTNVYAGVQQGLKRLDADRVSSLVLVTDGVTNQGIVDPAAFYKLLQGQDVRFYGFLLGNSGNWPLMQLMCDASGGYYRSVSNSDDIIGEIMIAKNKIVYESLRHAELSIDGIRTFDVSDFKLGKVHRGQQLVLFGRYEKGGQAKLTLTARVNDEERRYETEIVFPEVSVAHPELERLWAMDQARKIELNRLAGFVDGEEAQQAIRDLGIAYQIVTDETSMIALDDDSFSRYGIDRRNERRIDLERAAAQANQARNGATRVDAAKPMYQNRAPSVGGNGGGAVEPWMTLLAVVGGLLWVAVRRYREKAGKSAVASLLLAAIALGAAVGHVRADEADTYPRWTERVDSASRPIGSIDRSIASFWEVSAEEARVERRQVSPPERTYQAAPPSARTETGATAEGDARRLKQSRDRGNSSGHFGINLLNAIPLIDFVWGERRDFERDEYQGSARR